MPTTLDLYLRQVTLCATKRRRGILAALCRRGLRPRLTDWHVVFSGLVDTAGRQPALPLPPRTPLIRYWLAICPGADAILEPVAARARAAEARLIEPGVPARLIRKVTRAGTAGPRSACARQGRLDETIGARLRRVAVALNSAPVAAR
jgi:hypothetical protein